MGILKKISFFHPKYGIQYVLDLKRNFGHKMFWMMVSAYIGGKGAAYSFVLFFQIPYYREAGLPGQTQQTMHAVGYVPWTCKGFIGVLSDLFPLFGYEKRYYMLIYVLLGAPACLSLGFIPLDLTNRQPMIAGMLFFLIFLETAAIDLLMQGKYSQQMKLKPGTKGNLVTFAWFCTLTGQLLPAALVGPISDTSTSLDESLNLVVDSSGGDPRILFFIFFPFTLQPILPLLMGYLIDDHCETCKSNRFDFEKLKKQAKLITMTTLQSIISLATILFTFFGTSTDQMIYLVISAFFLCTINFYLVPNLAARFNTYNFLAFTLYINLQGALEYYYTADEYCVPNGPHFDYTMIKTYGQIAQTLAQVVGMIIFQVILSQWKFRFVFWTTTFIRILASVADIILVNRWNTKIGIPDFIMYLLGYSIVYQIAYMMDYIPQLIIIAKLCPKNVESTMFALLAGYSNFGTNIGHLTGVFLMDMFEIQTLPTDDKPCNFSNLTTLILIGHGLFPAITIPLVFFLIPNTYISDPLIESEKFKSKSLVINSKRLENLSDDNSQIISTNIKE